MRIYVFHNLWLILRDRNAIFLDWSPIRPRCTMYAIKIHCTRWGIRMVDRKQTTAWYLEVTGRQSKDTKSATKSPDVNVNVGKSPLNSCPQTFLSFVLVFLTYLSNTLAYCRTQASSNCRHSSPFCTACIRIPRDVLYVVSPFGRKSTTIA